MGAIFSVDPAGAVTGLQTIGRAFETLSQAATALQDKFTTIGESAFKGMIAGLDNAVTATTRMIEQVDRVAAAWDRAATAAERASAAGAGAGGGGRGGGGGGGGRGGGGRPPAEPGYGGYDEANRMNDRFDRNQRMNADAENRNYDQIRDNERRQANLEDRANGRSDGPMGPGARPYWGEGDDWRNSRWDKANQDQIDRKLRIQQNERDRGGLYGPPELDRYSGYDEAGRMNDRFNSGRRLNAEAENRNRDLVSREAERKSSARTDGGNDIIQTIVDYELLHTAFKSATGEQESLFRGAKAFNIDPTSEEGIAAMVQLRAAARGAAAGTSYKESATAAGIPLLAGPLGLSGQEGVNAFSDIYPGAARAAEGLELLDPSNRFSATLPAMIEYMHATRNYDPKTLPHSYDVLGAVTSLVPHTTFAAEAGAMSYVVPLAKAAGIPTDEAAILVGELQQAGLRGTVGATTLRQELVGLTRGGEALPKTRHSHQLAHETREFEHAMQLQGEQGRQINEATQGNAHQMAMKKVGLFDEKGHRTFLFKPGNAEGGEVGGVDINEANRIFAQWANRPGTTRADILQAGNDLFGIRGEMAPQILGNIIHAGDPNHTDYGLKFRESVLARVNAPGGFLETTREQMSKAAAQQEGQVAARFNDVLSHLADQTLPAFQGAMERALIPALNKLAGMTAPDAQGNYSVAQRASGGAAIGGLLGGVVGGGLGLLGVGAGIVPGAMAGSAIGAGIGGAVSAAYYSDKQIWNFLDPEHNGGPFDVSKAGPRALLPSGFPRPGPLSGSVSSAAAPAPITVNVTNTMNGVADEKTFSSMLEKLKDMIKSAVSRSTETAHGTDLSPYPSFGGF